MRIAVLAQDSASTWMMVNALRATWPDVAVMIEQPVSRQALLKRRAARLGLWPVLGQMLFMGLAPVLGRVARARRGALIAQAGLHPERPADMPISACASVNSAECIDWLRQRQPDVIVVNGTRIISADVLAASSAWFLNTHCGITPAYRGVHGAYWALYRNDAANAGVTVHLVNTGIDTGDIVYQETIVVDAHDNFVTYPVKQYIAGIPLMKRAIADVAAGRLKTVRRDDLPSMLWHHPTLWQYVWARCVRGVR